MKIVFQNTLMILFGCLIVFLGLELSLRYTTIFDQLESPAPTYRPNYLSNLSQEANKTGYITKLGFRLSESIQTTLAEAIEKETGCKIVVLGDSFVFGAGLAEQNRWTTLFKSKLSDECKVFPVGKKGWTVYEFLNYYDKNLSELNIDYVIVTIVSNDPHPRGTYRQFEFPPETMVRSKGNEIANKLGIPKLVYFRKHLYSYQYVEALVKALLDSYTPSVGSLKQPPIVSYGYRNWELRLWQKDTFEAYKESLNTFAKETKHNFGFLSTPTSNSEDQKEIFAKVKRFMDGAGYIHVPTMDDLDALFDGKLRPRNEWANLGDAHPGKKQSELYAEKATELYRALKSVNQK